MFRNIYMWSLAATTAFVLCHASAHAQGVAVIENFESYSSGTGNWTITDRSNITVSLGLNLTSPIQGNKDVKQTAAVSLAGNGFTLQNLSLNVPVPAQAENFTFSMKSLLALNVTRTATVTLVTAAGNHVSSAQTLPVLAVNAVANINVPFTAFTPPIPAGSTLTGAKLRFEAPVLALGLEEHIDNLRFTWDNSSVDDWVTY